MTTCLLSPSLRAPYQQANTPSSFNPSPSKELKCILNSARLLLLSTRLVYHALNRSPKSSSNPSGQPSLPCRPGTPGINTLLNPHLTHHLSNNSTTPNSPLAILLLSSRITPNSLLAILLLSSSITMALKTTTQRNLPWPQNLRKLSTVTTTKRTKNRRSKRKRNRKRKRLPRRRSRRRRRPPKRKKKRRKKPPRRRRRRK